MTKFVTELVMHVIAELAFSILALFLSSGSLIGVYPAQSARCQVIASV